MHSTFARKCVKWTHKLKSLHTKYEAIKTTKWFKKKETNEGKRQRDRENTSNSQRLLSRAARYSNNDRCACNSTNSKQ